MEAAAGGSSSTVHTHSREMGWLLRVAERAGDVPQLLLLAVACTVLGGRLGAWRSRSSTLQGSGCGGVAACVRVRAVAWAPRARGPNRRAARARKTTPGTMLGCESNHC